MPLRASRIGLAMDYAYEEWRSKMANRTRRTEGQVEKYPECAKWASIIHDKRVIEDFLDWCREKHDTRLARGDHTVFSTVRENMLREYFEIDSNKLEAERRAMLDEQRALNEKPVNE